MLKSGVFTYGVDVTRLKQWQRFVIPVIFVLWDTKNELGYWSHMQPQIVENLAKNPQWLANDNGTRNIHLHSTQKIYKGEGEFLSAFVEDEYHRLSANKVQMEKLQETQHISELQDAMEFIKHNKATQEIPKPISPKIQQQLVLVQYEAATLTEPNNASNWLEKARIYYDLLEMEKALIAINTAWQLGLRDTVTTLTRGCVLVEYSIFYGGEAKDMLYEAIQLFESLQGAVSDFILDYNIGNSYSALKQYDQAIFHFDKALAVHSDITQAAEIWKNRGTAYFHLNNHVEEIASYKKALKLKPDLWEAYSSWGVTELFLGNFESARDLFIKGLNVTSDMEKHGFGQIYSLAYALCKTGELEKAYYNINQLLALAPSHNNSIALKSYILSRLWRLNPLYIPSGLTFFKKLVINDPNDITAQQELYLVQEALTGYEFPFPKIEENDKLLQLTVPELHSYSIFLQNENQLLDALKCLQIAYDKGKEHIIVHALAKLKQKLQDYDGAIPLLIELLEVSPNSLPIIHEIANCYHFSHSYVEAIRFETKGLLLERQNPRYWENIYFAVNQLKKNDISLALMPILQDFRNGTIIDDKVIEVYTDILLDWLDLEFGETFIASVFPNEDEG